MRPLKARLLGVPRLYGWLQRGVSPDATKRIFVDSYVKPRSGDRLLDAGCGPGYLLRYLPDVDYVGFDPSESYIEAAREEFGDKGEFVVAGIDDITTSGQFDIVVAKGVLHHLDDEQVTKIAELAAAVLRPGGRLVCLDPALVDGQHGVARFLVSRDRGEHVRSPDGYRSLVAARLPHVEVIERHDLLRVPYTHAVIIASA